MFLRLKLILSVMLMVLYADLATAEVMRCWEPQGTFQPIPWNGINISQDKSVPAPDGKPSFKVVCEYDHTALRWPSFLNCRIPNKYLDGVKHISISFHIKGRKDSSITVQITEDAPDSLRLTQPRLYTLNGEWQHIEYTAPVIRNTGKNIINAPRITFHNFSAGDIFHFSSITIYKEIK